MTLVRRRQGYYQLEKPGWCRQHFSCNKLSAPPLEAFLEPFTYPESYVLTISPSAILVEDISCLPRLESAVEADHPAHHLSLQAFPIYPLSFYCHRFFRRSWPF